VEQVESGLPVHGLHVSSDFMERLKGDEAAYKIAEKVISSSFASVPVQHAHLDDFLWKEGYRRFHGLNPSQISQGLERRAAIIGNGSSKSVDYGKAFSDILPEIEDDKMKMHLDSFVVNVHQLVDLLMAMQELTIADVAHGATVVMMPTRGGGELWTQVQEGLRPEQEPGMGMFFLSDLESTYLGDGVRASIRNPHGDNIVRLNPKAVMFAVSKMNTNGQLYRNGDPNYRRETIQNETRDVIKWTEGPILDFDRFVELYKLGRFPGHDNSIPYLGHLFRASLKHYPSHRELIQVSGMRKMMRDD
jgi:hypothetical protein